MSDKHSQYDGYKRPSPVTCLVGGIVAVVIWIAIFVIVFVVFPQLRATLTYPLIAVGLVVLAGGGLYYLATSRKREQEHSAQDERRAVSDDWVRKELAESTYHATGDQSDAVIDDTSEK